VTWHAGGTTAPQTSDCSAPASETTETPTGAEIEMGVTSTNVGSRTSVLTAVAAVAGAAFPPSALVVGSPPPAAATLRWAASVAALVSPRERMSIATTDLVETVRVAGGGKPFAGAEGGDGKGGNAVEGSGCGGGGGVFGVCMATKGTRGIGTDAPPSVAVHGKPEIVEIIAVGARVAEMANATTSARAMLSARLT